MNPKSTLTLVHMADGHIALGSTLANTEKYRALRSSGRKMIAESEAIFDRQLQEVRRLRPDVLLLSGDLTKDGERLCHEAIARKLGALKKDLPDLHICLCPGNHDINNPDGFNFRTGESMNSVSPEQFFDLYRETVFEDHGILERYHPETGQAGDGSYAARPKEGFTILVLNSCCCTADVTFSGEDRAEGHGLLTAPLMEWALGQIQEADARGDVVIGMMHHNLLPHYTLQMVLTKQYLIPYWEPIAEAFADAGMHLIFTGHSHKQDVAKLVTKRGNAIFDIDTGAAVTFPSPMRSITVSGTPRQFQVRGETIEHLDLHFKDPVEGWTRDIPDLTEYGRGKMMPPAKFRRKFGPRVPESLVQALARFPVAKGHTFLSYLNFLTGALADGCDHVQRPYWFRAASRKFADGSMLDRMAETIAEQLHSESPEHALAALEDLLPAPFFAAGGLDPVNDVFQPILWNGAIPERPKRMMADFAQELVESYCGSKTDFPDNDFNLHLSQDDRGAVNDGKTAPRLVSPNADTAPYRALHDRVPDA